MTLLAKLTSRGLIKVSGAHAADFLQGLITQDVMTLGMGHGCYGCLLTPQGKYLYDFFIKANKVYYMLLATICSIYQGL